MTSEISDSGAALLVASALFIPPFTWWVVYRKLRHGSGEHWAYAHAAGILSAVIALLFAFIPFVAYEVSQIVGSGAYLLTGYWLLSMHHSVSWIKSIKNTSATPISLANPDPQELPNLPEPAIQVSQVNHPGDQEISDSRKRSLSAMKRASDARQRDMKSRSEQPAENIYTSRYLADIEFNYRDSGGHDSHRHVGVEAVDDEYFEGHCYTANDTRTFVIGRVRGKVTDIDTGELLPPKKWADGVRNDPRNSGVVKNRGWKSQDAIEEEERERPVEILFTGFSKERRAELEEQAEIFELVVRKNVTKGLKYLCAGPNAGPAKLAQAADAGVQIIDESEFVQLLVNL